MRQTLFEIPFEVAGWQLFGLSGILFWGWLVLCAIAIAAIYVRAGGWSKELQSLLPIFGVIAVLLGFALPFLANLATGGGDEVITGLPIRGYGVMMLCGIVIGVGLASYQAQRMGLDSEVIFSLAFWMFICGITGARIFYVYEYWNEFVVLNGAGDADTLATLRRTLNVASGGLVVYGSVLGAVPAAVIFLVRRGLPVLAVADLIAPSMVIGLALGRIGCFLNGCCFGGVCDSALAVEFPAIATAPSHPAPSHPTPPYAHQRSHGQLHGIRLAERKGEDGESEIYVAAIDPDGRAGEYQDLHVGHTVLALNGVEYKTDYSLRKFYPGLTLDLVTEDKKRFLITLDEMPATSLPVHPTQIYSAINAFLLFAVLWIFYPLRPREGCVFALMLTIYPLSRFLMEWVRTDEGGQMQTGLTISQIVSVGILVGIVCLWVWIAVRGTPRLSQILPKESPNKPVAA